LNLEPWGYSISKLFEELKEKIDIPQEIIEAAKYLDKLYIPTRYPNEFSEGYPGNYYTKNDAEKAIKNAREIIIFVKKFISK